MSITITGGITISGGGWTVTAATAANDPYFMYNTLLLPGNGTNLAQNNTFLDGSTNNFTVTRNGNTTQGTFSPYGGNWSNYVDTAYQGISNATSLIGATVTTFTAECWIYMTVAPASGDGVPCLIGMDALPASSIYLGFGPNASRQLVLRWFDGASKTATGGTALALNTWYHIAVVSNSNSIAMYVNGVAETLSGTTTLTNRNGTANSFALMSNSSVSAYQFKGYASNIRVTTTAVYTSAFTPSTTPLTSITNTSLLTCQSPRFIDTSVNNFTLTNAGNISVQRFSPFSPSSVTPTSYSGYFDGTGDYLTAPSNAVFGFGTGDFTIEGWFYFTGTIGTYQRPWWFGDDNDNLELNTSVLRVGGASQGTLITGGTTIVASTWYHIALTRASGSYKLWLNGTQQGSTATNSYNSSARTVTAMATSTGVQPSTGYVSNFRIVKGVAVYTGAFTVPTSPLTATQSSGTNIAAITGTSTSLLTLQSTTIVDNSTNNFTLTVAGNTQPTIQNPFGYTSALTNGYTVSTIGGSGYFDGTGDYLTLPSNQGVFSMSTGNFTIEMWIYVTSLAAGRTLYDTVNAGDATGTGRMLIQLSTSGVVQFGTGAGTTLTSGGTVLVNTWYHLAVTKASNSTRIFLNGTQVNSTYTDNNTYTVGTVNRPIIGVNGYDGSTNPMFGYISDLSVIKSTALYTSSFVPPSAPLTAIANTSLLLNYTNAGIIDNAMQNNLETVGNAQISTTQSKFGGSSMYFDGTGDYLVSPSNLVNSLGSDFTIEAWVYPTVASGTFGLAVAGTYDGASNGGWSLIVNRSNAGPIGLGFIYANAVQSTYGTYLSTNTWTYITVSRSGSTLRLFVNGTIVTTTTYSTVDSVVAPLYIGSQGTSSAPFQGYIDDLRITRGYARYTSNFAAPTSAFPIL